MKLGGYILTGLFLVAGALMASFTDQIEVGLGLIALSAASFKASRGLPATKDSR